LKRVPPRDATHTTELAKTEHVTAIAKGKVGEERKKHFSRVLPGKQAKCRLSCKPGPPRCRRSGAPSPAGYCCRMHQQAAYEGVQSSGRAFFQQADQPPVVPDSSTTGIWRKPLCGEGAGCIPAAQCWDAAPLVIESTPPQRSSTANQAHSRQEEPWLNCPLSCLSCLQLFWVLTPVILGTLTGATGTRIHMVRSKQLQPGRSTHALRSSTTHWPFLPQ
jgi:hypothetical protein